VSKRQGLASRDDTPGPGSYGVYSDFSTIQY
jgi:hypothetical protein